MSVEHMDLVSVQYGHSTQVYLTDESSGQLKFSIKGLFVGRTNMHVRFMFFERRKPRPCEREVKKIVQYDIGSHINFTSMSDEWASVSYEGQTEIVVIRVHRPIDTAFNIVIVLLVIVVNLGVGCKSELSVIKETLRRPIAPLTGLCCQFIIMPLLSYGAVKVFQFEPALALGFFALGCSPGGSASNAYTMLLGGDVSLSITMTLVSTLAALGMVPLWLLTLGRTLYSDTSINIPYIIIIITLSPYHMYIVSCLHLSTGMVPLWLLTLGRTLYSDTSINIPYIIIIITLSPYHMYIVSCLHLSTGMVPLWLLTLGRTLYDDTSINIPYQNIFFSLLGLLVPVCIGLLIQRKRPRLALTLIKVSKVVMIVFLVFVLTVGVYTNLYIFRLITLPVLGASAILPYVGFLLGGLVAFLFRMERARVLTVAIETGIQNTGIAIVLLLLSLPHPESDISIVAPIISALFTPLPLWAAIACIQGRRRCCPKETGQGKGCHEGEATEALKREEKEQAGKDEDNGLEAQNVENGVSLIDKDADIRATAI
ncbi:hypothetical protein ACOMHN_002232 [Nucella lapillus]